MQPSGGTKYRCVRRWHCATAIVLAVSPFLAHADGGSTSERQTFNEDNVPFEMANPCNDGRITGTAKRETHTRNTRHGNGSSEFRFEQHTHGSGLEDVSQVFYHIDERDRLNTRSNQQVSRFEQHLRQRGNPQRPLVPTPTSSLAVGFEFIEKNESFTNPARSRNEFTQERKCRDRDGDGKEDF